MTDQSIYIQIPLIQNHTHHQFPLKQPPNSFTFEIGEKNKFLLKLILIFHHNFAYQHIYTHLLRINSLLVLSISLDQTEKPIRLKKKKKQTNNASLSPFQMRRRGGDDKLSMKQKYSQRHKRLAQHHDVAIMVFYTLNK